MREHMIVDIIVASGNKLFAPQKIWNILRRPRASIILQIVHGVPDSIVLSYGYAFA